MNQLPKAFEVERVAGKGRGKKLGIPTLNFAIPPDLTLPHGIYAGWLIQDKSRFKAAIHFGPRPVFHETDSSLEAYVLEPSDINTKTTITLVFVAYMREIHHFPTPEEMMTQIDLDVKQIRQILS